MRRIGSVWVRTQATRLWGLMLVLALLATMVAPGGVWAAPAPGQAEPGATSYELAAGADGGALNDGGLSVYPAQGIARVRYYVNPSARDLASSTVGGTPAVVATKTPFVFSGPAISDGRHTLVAAIDLLDGRTVVKTAQVQAQGGELVVLPAEAPAVVPAAPAANCAPLNCSQVKVAAPYVLNFDQNQGGLPDKNGVGTGFTWVDKPTVGGTGYIPANLEVDTAAGLLKITTTAGIAWLAENNQDNTLGVGIDAASQRYLLETRLVNLPAMTGNLEQGGLWYGADNDNYLKLVVISEPEGPRVQFVEERAGALQQQVVSPVLTLTGASVTLRMRVDPATQAVTGYYSLNDGPMTELSRFRVPASLFNLGGSIDPTLGTRVFGGLFATDRYLQGVALFQFDYFSLISAGQLQRRYLPMVVNVGP